MELLEQAQASKADDFIQYLFHKRKVWTQI